MAAVFLSVLFVCLALAQAKVYTKCELVKTLRQAQMPENLIPTFTCIANFESHFDTQARNLQTNDFGIFQISAIYWCNDGPQPGKGCNKPCSAFLKDEIWDAIGCVQKIYYDTQKLGRNGFSAWTVWQQHCAGDNSQWIAGC